MTIACRQIRRLAGRYVDGEVTPEERRAVSQHLPLCAACSAAVRRQRLAAGAVATLPGSRPGAAVRAAVLAGPPTSVPRRLLLQRSARALALGSVAVLGIAALTRVRGAALARRAVAPPVRASDGQQFGSSPSQASASAPIVRSAAAAPTGVPAAPAGAWVQLSGPRVAFVGQQEVRTGFPGHSTLWLTSLSGGPAIALAQRDDNFLSAPAWSADGTKLYYVSGSFDVTERDLTTGQSVVRYALPHPSNFGVSEIFAAPDGHAVAFLRAGGMEDWELCLLPAGAGEPTMLHTGGLTSGLALAGWQRGTEQLLYLENGALWTLDPATRQATRVRALPPALSRFATISPDGRQALEIVDLDPRDMGQSVRRADLVVVDLTTGARRNLTSGLAYNVGTPSWSGDGAWIAFTTSPAATSRQPQPPRDLWLMRADGGERRNLTQGKDASVVGAAAVWTPLPAAARTPPTTATAAPVQMPVRSS